jgi:hypothetical protein
MIQVSGIRNAIDKRHDAIRIPIALEIAAHVSTTWWATNTSSTAGMGRRWRTGRKRFLRR